MISVDRSDKKIRTRRSCCVFITASLSEPSGWMKCMSIGDRPTALTYTSTPQIQ